MILNKHKYVFKTIIETALKHVTMRLISSWQRLSGFGMGPESGTGPPCMGAAAPK